MDCPGIEEDNQERRNGMKMRMKRWLALVLALLLAAAVTGCAGNGETQSTAAQTEQTGSGTRL